MPDFRLIATGEAQARTATGKRAQFLQEYVGYIQQLREGSAGTLSPAAGESLAAVRRRLGKAAAATGRDLVIKRTADALHFWDREGSQTAHRRPGRPRKNPLA